MAPPSSHRHSSHSLQLNPHDEEIDIYLKLIKTVAVKVKKSETIKNLKTMFREKEGVPEISQELFFAGDQLKDDKTLLDCGIPRNSTLHLFIQDSFGMKIYVKIPSNQKTIVVEVKKQYTVQNIKSMIQALEGIQPDQYSLFHAGKLLEDNRTLASLNLQNESTLNLIFNPKDVLLIYVKAPSEESFELDVKLLHKVCDVKAILGNLLSSPVEDWDLSYAQNRLEDWNTLAHYGIEEKSILKLLPAKIQIFVKPHSGSSIVLEVHRLDIIRDVKEKIFDKLGTPVNAQRLVFAGKRLLDDRNLASYNIQKNSTILMV
ncbi:polyubiquitin isoform X1 [Quercus suber]|uniref:polyubiquitin isoform X1 n=1 Tax=Quercus suber TaxID=58331 RepID=UPI000CE1CEB8|nr:polyubiquitin-like isoform X1 [Quercus suber]POF24679.1 ubiquitin-60s ribosomal protein l40 [Quercus suber]